MDLLSQLLDPPINVLPQDGEANYHGIVLNLEDADYICATGDGIVTTGGGRKECVFDGAFALLRKSKSSKGLLDGSL